MQIKKKYLYDYVLFCVLCQKQLIKFDKSFLHVVVGFFLLFLIQHWKFPFINHLITQNSTTFLFGIKLLKEKYTNHFLSPQKKYIIYLLGGKCGDEREKEGTREKKDNNFGVLERK